MTKNSNVSEAEPLPSDLLTLIENLCLDYNLAGLYNLIKHLESLDQKVYGHMEARFRASPLAFKE